MDKDTYLVQWLKSDHWPLTDTGHWSDRVAVGNRGQNIERDIGAANSDWLLAEGQTELRHVIDNNAVVGLHSYTYQW